MLTCWFRFSQTASLVTSSTAWCLSFTRPLTRQCARKDSSHRLHCCRETEHHEWPISWAVNQTEECTARVQKVKEWRCWRIILVVFNQDFPSVFRIFRTIILIIFSHTISNISFCIILNIFLHYISYIFQRHILFFSAPYLLFFYTIFTIFSYIVVNIKFIIIIFIVYIFSPLNI